MDVLLSAVFGLVFYPFLDVLVFGVGCDGKQVQRLGHKSLNDAPHDALRVGVANSWLRRMSPARSQYIQACQDKISRGMNLAPQCAEDLIFAFIYNPHFLNSFNMNLPTTKWFYIDLRIGALMDILDRRQADLCEPVEASLDATVSLLPIHGTRTSYLVALQHKREHKRDTEQFTPEPGHNLIDFLTGHDIDQFHDRRDSA